MPFAATTANPLLRPLFTALQVVHFRSQLPSPEYAVFMDTLEDTIRYLDPSEGHRSAERVSHQRRDCELLGEGVQKP